VGCPTSAFPSSRCRAVSNLGIGQLTLLWAALPRRSPPFVVVGLGCFDVGQPRSLWAALPQRSPPSSLWSCVPQCWVAHNDVGSPIAAIASSRPRVLSNLSVRLPASMWAALLRRSLPLVVVWRRTSALGSPRRCGLPYCGVCVVVGCGPWRCRGIGVE